MKKQYFINANIIDPHNSLNEVGGLIIGEDGKIEAVGKKVNTNNIPSREKFIDLKLTALSKYTDEVREFPHPRSLENVENVAKYFGSQVGLKFAEPFCLIRSKLPSPPVFVFHFRKKSHFYIGFQYPDIAYLFVLDHAF